ncbi:hypothetical protein FRC03_011029 [Tulasnella sp. 419]|nr:hypothetical protein FRC03_011029 [Tulasnella sp. 419]
MYPPNTHLRGPVGDRRGSYLRIFLRQTYSLIVRKNWIVFANHWLVNLLRCVLFPIGFAFFIAYAQDFLIRSGNLGLGTAVPIYPLKDVFGGKLMWVDATGGGGSPSAVQIMSAMTDSFSPAQKAQVHSTSSKEDLIVACPSNFNGKSSCYAAIIFTAVPTPQNTSQPLQYSILSDPGLYHIDVKNHKGDVEKRLLPLQWAIDSTFIQLQTGVQVPVPRQQPFTHVTNEEERAKKRDSFLGVVDDILVIVFWLFFAGLLYHTAGGVALERATSLTTHLQAMGCLRPARYISWHLSVSLVYLPAWVIAASVWKHMIFVHTSTALLVGINVVTGFSLTSWGLLVVTPFAKSPQLAAIVTTVLSFVLAILAMTYVNSQGFALLFTILFPPSFFIFAIRSVCGWEKVSKSPIPGLEDPSWRHFVISSLIGAAVFSIFIHPLLAMWIERMLFDTKARRPGLFSRMFGRHTSEDSHNHGQVNAIEVRNLRKEFKSRTGRNIVTAIADLSISIPRNGIFVVLGPNGSGKSTLHGIISNIISPTSGSVTFAGGAAYPDRGDIGVVPQKNVLFPELTCRQTVRLWSDIKRPVGAELDDIDQLLLDCDLSSKVHAKSGSLSGGQKRKLQLAIGLVGGSSSESNRT